MLRAIFIGCLIVVAAVVLLALGASYYVYRQYQSVFEIPAQLEEPSVLVGEGLLSSEEVFSDPSIGWIYEITKVDFDQDGAEDMVLVGSSGAAILNESLEVQQKVLYEEPISSQAKVTLTDLEVDGSYEFLVRGSWDSPVKVLDADGKERWNYTGTFGIDDAAAGDIDGDGDREVVVGMNGGGGVHLLDSDGSVLWTQPDGNVWQVDFVSSNSGEGLDIVHSNAAGQITIRNASGSVVLQSSPGAYFSDFNKIEWFGLEGDDQLLLAEDDKIWVFDLGGKVLATWDAPLAGTLGEVAGVLIQFTGQEAKHFACLVNFSSWGRSILYLFDADGKLLYQEVLAQPSHAIMEKDGDLLVGTGGALRRYRLEDGPNGG
ncbi:MAG: hypothetical protein H6752_04120 [Candidatus Omnitrophica bacterium]|nr:hypothetical protein [Candidatus Omnitrophota bacterium]